MINYAKEHPWGNDLPNNHSKLPLNRMQQIESSVKGFVLYRDSLALYDGNYFYHTWNPQQNIAYVETHTGLCTTMDIDIGGAGMFSELTVLSYSSGHDHVNDKPILVVFKTFPPDELELHYKAPYMHPVRGHWFLANRHPVKWVREDNQKIVDEYLSQI